MPTPTSKECPDMYEYDFQDPRNGASEAYWNSILPEHLKQRLAKRKAKEDEPARETGELSDGLHRK